MLSDGESARQIRPVGLHSKIGRYREIEADVRGKVAAQCAPFN